jgi:hypothetical protein
LKKKTLATDYERCENKSAVAYNLAAVEAVADVLIGGI